VFSQSREYNFENEKKLSHFQDGKFKVLSHHGFSKNHIISSVCLKKIKGGGKNCHQDLKKPLEWRFLNVQFFFLQSSRESVWNF